MDRHPSAIREGDLVAVDITPSVDENGNIVEERKVVLANGNSPFHLVAGIARFDPLTGEMTIQAEGFVYIKTLKIKE